MRELNLESHEDLLSETASQIARLIGFQAMQRLVARFGGASFPIGRNLRCTGDRRLAMLRETIGGAIHYHNLTVADDRNIRTVVFPAMGAGCGRVPPASVVAQMKLAWLKFISPPR